MKSRFLAIVAVLSYFLVLLANPHKAYACSCFRDSVKGTLATSTAVFMGKVVDSRDEKRPRAEGGSYIAHIYTLAVIEAWKGVNTPKIEAIHKSDYVDEAGNSVLGCQSNGLALGGIYLVYAWQDRSTGELQAALSYCNRTALRTEAVADISELGPGQKIAGQEEMPPTGKSFQPWWLLGVGIASAIVVGGYILRKQRSLGG